MRGLFDKADIHNDHEVTRIDMRERQLRFRNGSSADFGTLISSIPLPKLIPLIADASREVQDAAARLACSQAVVVNIGLNRPVITKPQWSYFYDEDIPFARISYRANLSPNAVPPGCGAFQAEIYFSDKYRPMTGRPEDWIEPTIDAMIRCGLVADRSEVIHQSAIWIPFGNVIFDHDRRPPSRSFTATSTTWALPIAAASASGAISGPMQPF